MNLNTPLYNWFSAVVEHARYDQFRRRLRELPFSRLSDNQASYDFYPLSSNLHFNDNERQDLVEKNLKFLMSELSVIERKTVELTFLNGMSLNEISEQQRISSCALAKKRRRALKKMRQKSDDQDVLIEKNDALAKILGVTTTNAV